jgi:hypothetical protein
MNVSIVYRHCVVGVACDVDGSSSSVTSSKPAPGQMGVVSGRATCTDGLRIVNYNSTAARLKHDQVVYDFYGLDSKKLIPFLMLDHKFQTNIFPC